MKSFWLKAAGGGTVLELRDVTVPEPGANQVLVQMRAASLNRGEFLARRDLHGTGSAKPSGNEGAGEVIRTGPGVTAFKPGDRVMGIGAGAFSEFALMDARTAMPVPNGLSWEEAACIPLVFLVTHDILIGQGHLRPDDWVLVVGASSGVGVACVQAAKALGAKTIGTSGSDAKLRKLRELGLDVSIHTRKPNFHEAVMEATANNGANIVVNCVGGTMFPECMRSLAFQGRFATVGYVDGVVESNIDIAALHAHRLTLYGVSAIHRTMEQRIETVRGFTADLLPYLADGTIKTAIDKTFPFSELPAAKEYMESNAHVGKIAVTVTS
jgi:NADPH:quinone reductase-like Zn-dependent oxidoreductase